ncbi:MAG: shikimate dehydrogenase [Thermoleophilia bacterium]|nr:shikimate dehydrogenase [Thermoleophilia bacterium]
MISGTTRLLGVIGDPVAHSRSPRMQNAALQALRLNWAYVPLPVKAADLERVLRGLQAVGFVGVNVTVPHKEAVAQLVDELRPTAQASGSVNTVIFAEDGRLVGDSTDGPAIAAAIASEIEETYTGSVLVLGAGGSARAAAAALAQDGCAVQLYARRFEAAEALARDLAGCGNVVALAALPDPVAGVVVNCTPVGALVDPEGMPLPASRLLDVRVVVDLAYRADATTTPLITAASETGCAVVDGLEVLARQGAKALEIWTGESAPLEVMLAAARGD